MHDDAAAHAVFLDTPRQIIAYVSNHPRALGLVDFVHARRDRDVRMLQISNSSPSREAFTRRAWPLGATIRAVTSGTGEPSEDVVRFLDFLASEAARKVIRLGFTLPNRKK